MAAPTLSQLHAAVLGRLRGPGGFNPADVHDGDVKDPTLDADGRIQPYVVLWSAPGHDPERPITGSFTGGGEHRLHVTVAGQDARSALWAHDRARALLDGVLVDVGDPPVQAGIRWLDGYTADPVRPDKDYHPWRWFSPLLFSVLI